MIWYAWGFPGFLFRGDLVANYIAPPTPPATDDYLFENDSHYQFENNSIYEFES